MFVRSHAESIYNLNEIGEHQFVDNCMNHKVMIADFTQNPNCFTLRRYKNAYVCQML